MSDELKSRLLKYCFDSIESSRRILTDRLKSVKESISEETKSSAGDKHETARAMLQIERENLGNQLMEIEQMLGQLTRINLKTSSENAHMGNIIQTNFGAYFIAISLGEVRIDSERFYIVSPKSPIGKLIIGKKVGESFQFNGNDITIRKIL